MWCTQVSLAKWQPGKALEQVLAATQLFHQASTACPSLPTAPLQQDTKLQQAEGPLQPSLWLQSRLQVADNIPCDVKFLCECCSALLRHKGVTSLQCVYGAHLALCVCQSSSSANHQPDHHCDSLHAKCSTCHMSCWQLPMAFGLTKTVTTSFSL